MKRPLKLGLSACFFHSDPQRAIFKGKTLLYLEQSIAHWVMSQGALAYLIPNLPANSTVKMKHLVSEFDGLVLQGGSDVSPRCYGEEPLRPEWSGDYIRDQYEIELFRHFMEQEKPILGICRGMQLINVALGGTLYQDIETQVEGALCHRNWEIYDRNFHQIDIAGGSDLSQLYKGIKKAKVNSVHHQALKDLAPGLMIQARTPEDGIIEAVRYDSRNYVVAVQWHPEFHDPSDSSLLDSAPLLKDFLRAVDRRRRED